PLLLPAGVSRVLDHLAARLRARLALVGAALHVLVVRELAAGVAAGVARLGAGLADRDRHRPLARRDPRRGRADLRAIDAGAQRGHVVLLAVGDHVGTLAGARVAHALAVVARLGAVEEGARVVVVRRLVGRLVVGTGADDEQQGGAQAEQGEETGT